ncbi:lysophospholipid acyltransferase family protein [Micromonospora carbonacea]|uniref:1-acyl-sn-glycerol-3-phosphate acyltransferases n=1 Tax=Micromonospora carbonacea TaxID=47853 RepID=A0A1C4UTN9_9ACTN|nr:lysophospholipid acyltransferase family protein [Micromonospora carbonacea]SCE74982.1 1-acyl-sn-glycerol-3-phosphate acyltransferases [Micromonospora carbonacea]
MTARHDLWRPISGCDADCLPGPGETPTVPVARRLGRLAAVLLMLVAGAALAGLLPVLPARERRAALRGWARGAARACGVRLVVRGRLPRRPSLVVANHASWLDVLALLAVAPARVLAKREVRRWPLVGPLAVAVGTLFVDRARPRALPAAVRRVAAALRAGHPVAVFPEGTTWCGAAVGCRPGGGFRPAVFQAAVDAGAPVVPVRIGYHLAAAAPAPGLPAAPAGGPTTVGAFLGAESMGRSVWRVLATRGLTVTVTATAALHPGRDADRRRLARIAESAVHLVPPRAAAAAVPPRAAVPVLPLAPGSPRVAGTQVGPTSPAAAQVGLAA